MMVLKRQMVVFKIGLEEFAIDILHTKEVVEVREITPVPETREYVEGVMNLRGSLVPVLDFRKKLKGSRIEAHAERRIIIAIAEGRLTGLIVDGASEVLRMSEEVIEPAPDIISEIGADYVTGVVNIDGRIITIIDLKKALRGEISVELDEVMKLIPKAVDGARLRARTG